jgi:hypothetical protein
MKVVWDRLRWRVLYNLRSPYLRPHRIIYARMERCRPPDFLIIGTERGGTTSLYNYLAAHSRVRRALRKEINFFDENYSKGWAWYLAHFPIYNQKDDFLTGEASPSYLFFPEVPSRVATHLPDTRIIVLLRNPVDRAYSHYHHEASLGYEALSFEDALSREVSTDKDGNWQLTDLRSRGLFASRHYSYLSKGIYIRQLRRWMEVLPRSRFFVAKSEDFFQNPSHVFSQVLEFLHLSPEGGISFRKYNEGQYEPLDLRTRSKLQSFYSSYNRELSLLLNTSFTDWA